MRAAYRYEGASRRLARTHGKMRAAYRYEGASRRLARAHGKMLAAKAENVGATHWVARHLVPKGMKDGKPQQSRPFY